MSYWFVTLLLIISFLFYWQCDAPLFLFYL